MSSANLEHYVAALQNGDREICRQVMTESLQTVTDPIEIYETLLWPAMERIERLYRGHRICTATEHMATRINRTLADQLQTHLVPKAPRLRTVVITCADGEPEELSAQIGSDIFESDGWQVFFVGGGVPHDEIMTLLGKVRPDLYLMVGTQPQGVPGARALIDLIRELDAHPTMNIMVSGGVFNRASGLWKEIRADLFAPTIMEALRIANESGPRVPSMRTLEPIKRRQRRRTGKPDIATGMSTFTLSAPGTAAALALESPSPTQYPAESLAMATVQNVERP